MEKPRRANLKPPGKCIFCGGGNLTKEHFWPRWARALLPTYPENRHIEQIYTFVEKNKLVRQPDTLERPGNASTKKIRVVCKSCNSGWMSGVEEAARALLTPLIKGESLVLNHTVSALSRWIVLKVMVGEHNQPTEVVTTEEQRRRFWRDFIIPENLHIWIGKCGIGGWETAYWRNAVTMSWPTDSLPTNKNVQSVTFGIGALLVHVLHSTITDLTLYTLDSSSNATALLWPNSGQINWPPPKTLTANGASYIATALSRAIASPKVVWKPVPVTY
jgi:hypothetical protein